MIHLSLSVSHGGMSLSLSLSIYIYMYIYIYIYIYQFPQSLGLHDGRKHIHPKHMPVCWYIFRAGRMSCGGKNITNYIQYFLPLVLFSLCALLLIIFILCVLLSSHVCLLYYVCIAVLLQMPDCWLEVRMRMVLRPATSTQVFLGFPVSISEC